MSRYDLLAALGDVDEASVKEAKEIRKKSKAVWAAIGSLAACLILALMIPFTMDLLERVSEPVPEASGHDVIFHLGMPITSDKGTITLTRHDAAKHTVTFVFDLADDFRYGFCFDGFDSDTNTAYSVIPPYDSSNLQLSTKEAVRRFDGLSYTVNGEHTESLPFAAGSYEITVDYSGMFEYCDTVSTKMRVIGFGRFSFDDGMDEVRK